MRAYCFLIASVAAAPNVLKMRAGVIERRAGRVRVYARPIYDFKIALGRTNAREADTNN